MVTDGPFGKTYANSDLYLFILKIAIVGMKLPTTFVKLNCQQYLWNEIANSIYGMELPTAFVE
jgi:hypothetical protein